jgi:predicted nucleotidyltransferase
MILTELINKKVVNVPLILKNNTMYLTMMGSHAYGCAMKDSDIDYNGVFMPAKTDIFPHLDGEIIGFGDNKPRLNYWQQHHVMYKEQEYDFAMYGIVKYFNLAMANNPNIIDSLFVPRRCIVHTTPMWEHVRENRHLFLHKGSFHKLKGYAYSQLAQMKKSKYQKMSMVFEMEEKYDIPRDTTFEEVENEMKTRGLI